MYGGIAVRRRLWPDTPLFARISARLESGHGLCRRWAVHAASELHLSPSGLHRIRPQAGAVVANSFTFSNAFSC